MFTAARAILMGLAAAIIVSCSSAGEIQVVKTERGASVETDRYKAVFTNGLLVSFFNKLTSEEYLDSYTKPENILPHLPSGLGTQAPDESRESARKLYHWPWYEFDRNDTWSCQHFANSESQFAFAEKGKAGCILTYTGLTDGKAKFADESYVLDISVEDKSGELLVVPQVKSPRAGVFSASLTVSALAPAITAEAPIFDGMQVDRNMAPQLYSNSWGGFWDYGLVAFNGYKRGAVAIWTEDAELKYYKTMFYLVNQEGVSFSFSYMSIPPFDKLTESKAATPWRFQAYDKSWSQAAARYRDWRLKNVKIAPRPEWTKHISFVSLGVHAAKGWLDVLSDYMGGKDLDRTVTFCPVIRKANFDTKHWDNSPYDKFKEDMAAWKPSGAKLMAYLQPMIVWGSPSKEDAEKAAPIMKWHEEADTRSVFQKDITKRVDYVDQHNLGHIEWQKWFLGCVKNYIQDCGADGVYHDQSYHCPIDVRGSLPMLNNMTSTQGMADYFFKAQTENPNSIHGTEHMTEVNNVGTSLGIGGGILWGTAGTLRHQRIKHGSPISNALNYPNGVIFSFPHYSDLAGGNALRSHWGYEIMERRAEIPGLSLQSIGVYSGKAVSYDKWVNELWLERIRATTFVHSGLRPVFPEDWDRNVRSYFKGINGEDFRYENTPWGSDFVQVDAAGKKTMLYGRIHNARAADLETGAIPGWICYNSNGPSGLHPDRYYVVNPALSTPEVCFSTGSMFTPTMTEGYLDYGYANKSFVFARFKAVTAIGNILGGECVVLHATKAPWRVLVNGVEYKDLKARKSELPRWKGQDEWPISYQLQAQDDSVDIVVFLDEPKPGFDNLAEQVGARITTSNDYASDYYDQAWVGSLISADKEKDGKPALSIKKPDSLQSKVHQFVALRAPAGAKEGTIKIGSSPAEIDVNGKALSLNSEDMANPKAPKYALVNLKEGEVALLRAISGNGVKLTFTWQEKEAVPAAAPAAK